MAAFSVEACHLYVKKIFYTIYQKPEHGLLKIFTCPSAIEAPG
jgi:hypothetical protein